VGLIYLDARLMIYLTQDQANANARPQTPLTICALTMPTEAAASLGERPLSGKMTNHVVKVGGYASRQTAPTQ